MTNSIFQGSQYKELEARAVAAAHAVHLKMPDLLRFGLLRLLEEIEQTGELRLRVEAREGVKKRPKRVAGPIRCLGMRHGRRRELTSAPGIRPLCESGGGFPIKFRVALDVTR